MIQFLLMVIPAEIAKGGTDVFTLERLVVGEDVKFTGTVKCPSCKDTTFVTFIRPITNIPPTITMAQNCTKCNDSFRTSLDTGMKQVTVSLL